MQFCTICFSDLKKKMYLCRQLFNIIDMTTTNPPRTLVYKDIDNIDYFLGDKSESSLEREFYDRLFKRPFIKRSDNPLRCAISVFSNARYIYYLIYCEVDNHSQFFNVYLTKAAERIEETKLESYITAATMALVYNWLSQKLHENRKFIPELKKEVFIHFDESKEEDIKNLQEKIYLHYSKEKEAVTEEIISDFHALLMKESKLPTNIDTYFEDIRDIEDAAFSAPIQDVASGIDYLMECYDPQNGTNAEQYFFLCKILKRFENEKSPTSDSKTIEKAIITIKQKLQSLESAPKEEFSLGLSIEDLNMVAIEEDPVITPEIKGYIEWIRDNNKAPKILSKIKEYMNGKTKPKLLLMPLCAAYKAELIDKPTWTEYKKVFTDHPISSDSLLRKWILDGERDYKGSTVANHFNGMLEEFTKIKNSAL